MKKYFPILLNLQNKKCLVVGGGAVAQRKIENILDTGVKIKCVSIEFTDDLLALLKQNSIEYYKRPFEISDLDDMDIVFAATNDSEINKQIYQECEKRKILINVVDNPQICTFIVPAIINRGDLTIAVSTSGKFPGLSKKIRKEIEKKYGNFYTEYLEIISEIRNKIIQLNLKEEEKKEKIEKLLDLDILALIENGKLKEARKKAEKII